MPTPPRLLVLDFETTQSNSGLRAVEIGGLLLEKGKVTKEFQQLVNPQCPIDFHSQSVHGISDHDVANQPDFSHFWPEFLALLENSVVLAHNAMFEARVLRDEINRHGFPAPRLGFWCTLRLSRKLWPELSSHKLGFLQATFNLPGQNSHRSLDDAKLALELYQLQVKESAKRGMAKPSVKSALTYQGKCWPF
jgi:DNA polymerase III subunit epsilon